MWTGVQWTGTLAAGASARYFTFNWPAAWHVVWYMMPTTVRNGAPELDWDVAVERADSTHCTYWITVKNLAAAPTTFEGRFAVMSS
jgi:hypothetical protein